jgi:signal peptidase I
MVYNTVIYNAKKIIQPICNNYWLKTLIYLLLVFLLAIFLRVFLFEVYTIPSRSMEHTLVPGDKVLVSKLRYGPFLPGSLKDVPWLNIFYSGNKAKGNKTIKTGRRLKGYGSIHRGDVMVFEQPANHQAYIKRCMGLPGDSLSLAGDTLYVDGQRVKPAPTLKHDYLVATGNNKKLEAWSKKKGIWLQKPKNGKWKTSLSMLQKQQLVQTGWADSLILLTDARKASFYAQRNPYNTRASTSHSRGITFGSDSTITGWKKFRFGPLYIPKKEGTIRLNEKNLHLYREIIEHHEGHWVKQNKGKVMIDGKRQKYYHFTHNYYFMLGDNRCHSSDSRAWGFVPESHIIGKAEFILFSNWHGKVRWGRFFKFIK